MKDFTFLIDGQKVVGKPGQTIIQAADEAGIYIPRLCAHSDLAPHGSCRVCTVLVNGRPQTACTQPVSEDISVENNTGYLNEVRRGLVDMLFIEGNHYCMFCEKSGCCELQAVAYRLGIKVPRFPYRYPPRGMDATHPDVFIDHNRCILCARCIIASGDIDKKNVFGFTGRGEHKRLAVNSRYGAVDTNISKNDKAMDVCPVGTLMRKHVGYAVPMGKREFDLEPIGAEIEARTRIVPCQEGEEI